MNNLWMFALLFLAQAESAFSHFPGEVTQKAYDVLQTVLVKLEKLEMEDGSKKSEFLDAHPQNHQALLMSPLALEPRHMRFQDGVLFTAYQTSQVCGTGTIGSWTLDPVANVLNGALGSTAFSTGGVFTSPTAGYYFFSACLLCKEGSACDVIMRYNGANIVAFGSRSNTYRNRFAQMCQNYIQLMTVGSTFLLHEGAGGGNPQNCKRSSNSYRYGRFNGYLIETNPAST